MENKFVSTLLLILITVYQMLTPVVDDNGTAIRQHVTDRQRDDDKQDSPYKRDKSQGERGETKNLYDN